MTGSASPIVTDPVRPGLRSGLRGHAAARARHSARSTPRRLRSPTVALDEILDAGHRAYPSARRNDGSSMTTVALTRHARRAAETAAPAQRENGPPADAGHGPRSRAASARHRPDREHQHLQRQVRLLPARRDAPPAGRDGLRPVPEDRRRVRDARHQPRARAQLRRAVPRQGSSSRRCAYAKSARHPGSRA